MDILKSKTPITNLVECPNCGEYLNLSERWVKVVLTCQFCGCQFDTSSFKPSVVVYKSGENV